ncbi:MAG: VOC family protein [Deltaproteobacteria bacterium]|nr:VOC family protein [Deltaproteobacteria bacterium]
MLDLDHVILLARDVEKWSKRLERECGLRSCGGGTHPSGTRTRIVPLQPPHYIEVMGVVAGARDRPLASMLACRLDERGDHFFGWAVRTDDIDREARRLRRAPQSGGGETVHWRTIRPAAADADDRPFFIQYDGDSGTAYLERRAEEANSPAGPGGFAWIEVASEPSALAEWLGPHELPIRLTNGAQGVHAVGIDAPGGVIELRISD